MERSNLDKVIGALSFCLGVSTCLVLVSAYASLQLSPNQLDDTCSYVYEILPYMQERCDSSVLPIIIQRHLLL